MRITEVEPIVLRADVDVSRADGTQDAFLVRIHTDEGLVGIGEADTSPYLAYTMVEMPSSHSIAMGLREVLIGADPLETEHLWWRMLNASEHYGGGGVAVHVISAIDIALWDLVGKTTNRSVHQLLGGSDPRPVRVYASEVMPEAVDRVGALAERIAERGFTALKLGWGPLGQSLANDLALISAAREALGMERDLMIDGGRGYSVRGAVELMQRCEEQRLFWLEEPLRPDDLEGYARLSTLAPTRIASGEADWGVPAFRALAAHGVDVLQPDLARCGGFTVARGLIQLSRERAVDIVPHCFSTGVLVAASLQFVAAMRRPMLCEFPVTNSPLASGLLTTSFELDENGCISVPTKPGLGVELDEAAIERHRRYPPSW
jgi:L-rhamnonate dehydratase